MKNDLNKFLTVQFELNNRFNEKPDVITQNIINNSKNNSNNSNNNPVSADKRKKEMVAQEQINAKAKEMPKNFGYAYWMAANPFRKDGSYEAYELETKFNKGTYSATNNKKTSFSALKEKGWNNDYEGETNVYPALYNAGGKYILMSPIERDGNILTPEALSNLAMQIASGKKDYFGVYLGTFDSEKEANEYFSDLNVHKARYEYKNPDIGKNPYVEHTDMGEYYYNSKLAGEFGEYGKGNINLYEWPTVKNYNGEKFGFSNLIYNDNGTYVVIPKVLRKHASSEPEIMEDSEAIERYKKINRFYGKFNTLEEAEEYRTNLTKLDYFIHNQPENVVEDNVSDNTTKQNNISGNGTFLGALGTKAKHALENVGAGVKTTFMNNASMGLEQFKSNPEDIMFTTPEYRKEYYKEIDEIKENIDNNIIEDYKKRAEKQKEEWSKYNNLPKWQQITAELVGSSAQLIPQIAAGAIDPTLGTALLASQVYGNAYAESLSEGADKGQSMLFALGSMAMEVTIEKAFGGIPGMGKGLFNKRITKAAASLVSQSRKSAVLNYVFNSLGEGGEEVASALLTPLLKRMTYDKNAEFPSTEELILSAAGGVVGSALFGGIELSLSLNTQRKIDNKKKLENEINEKINKYFTILSNNDVKNSDVSTEILNLTKEIDKDLMKLERYNKNIVNNLTDYERAKIKRINDNIYAKNEENSRNLYSIERINGTNLKYVKADRQVVTGNTPKEWGNSVENYINETIRQGKDVQLIAEDGDVLTITSDTSGKAKFRNFAINKDGIKVPINDEKYLVKLNAESHIDELAQVSTRGKKTVPDKKNHKFAKDGFNYRTAYFQDFDGQYYKLTLSVGKNGEVNTVYNIGKIKEASLSFVAQRPGTKSAWKFEASNNNVPQNKPIVNSNNMQGVGKVYYVGGGIVSKGNGITDIGVAHEQARAEGKKLNNVEAAEAVALHNDMKNNIGAESKKVLAFASKLTNSNIIVSRDITDDNLNGVYDRENNAIVLNYNKIGDHKYVLNAVLTHEMTHFAETSKYYSKLVDLVLQDKFGDINQEAGKNLLNQAIKDKINEYAGHGKQINEGVAVNEIVAERLAGILTNPETNQKAIFDLCAKDIETAKGFLDGLKSTFKKLKNQLSSVSGYYLKYADLTTYDKAIHLFEKAIKDAGNRNAKGKYDYSDGKTRNNAIAKALQKAGIDIDIYDVDSKENSVKYDFTKTFEEQVSETLHKNINDGNQVYVGETSSILKQIGLNDKPMLITRGHLRDINHPKDGINSKYHGISEELINELPDILDYPAIIFDSISVKNPDAVCMLSEKVDSEGNPVIIAIKPDGEGKYNQIKIESNEVLSMYGKDGFKYFLKNLNERSENILFMDEKRTQAMLKAARLQLPAGMSKLKFNHIIHKTKNVVNVKNDKNIEFVDNLEQKASYTDYSALAEAEDKQRAERRFETVKEQKYYEKAVNTLRRGVSRAFGIHNLKMDEAVNKRLNDISEKYLETREFAQADAEALFDEIYKNSEFASSESVVNDKKTFDELLKDFTDSLDTLYRFKEGRLGKKETELPEIDWQWEESNNIADKSASKVVFNGEELIKLYEEKSNAQKIYAKAEKQILLSDKDKVHLDRLVKGEIEEADIPKTANKDGIMALYDYKAKVNDIDSKIKQYNAVRKEMLNSRAKTVTENSDKWKDKKMGLAYSRETMERNIYDIVGNQEEAEAVIEEYFTPVHINEANRKRDKNKYRGIIKGLNLSRKVEKGNSHSESYAVQFLGEINGDIEALEKRYNLSTEKQPNKNVKKEYEKKLEELYKQKEEFIALNPDLNYNKINNAIKVFRGVYDELFQEMNLVRVKNGYSPVDYKQSYFPHFINAEPEGIINKFAKAIGINTDVTELPTNIAGRTHAFKPGTTFSGHLLRRKGTLTEYDALEGFDKYIESISDVIHHTEDLQKLRILEKAIREKYSDEGVVKELEALRNDNVLDSEEKERRIDELKSRNISQLNNFVQELTEYTNILANKKSESDRKWERGFGRVVYNFFNGINKNVAVNMVAGNLSSAFTNFIPLTQAKAECSTISLLKAGAETVRNYANSDGMINNSSFLTNRLVGDNILVKKASDKISNVLMKPMEFIDNFTSQVIWRARYLDNIGKGLGAKDAIMEADRFAANVLADRSKGALPTVFSVKNPFAKTLTMFQVEVNNQLSYLFKDVPRGVKKKRELAASLMWYFLGAYLFNDLYELLMGRRPALDLIGSVNKVTGSATGKKLPNTFKALSMYMNGENLLDTKKKDAFGVASDVTENVTENIPFVGGLVGGGRIPVSSGIPFLEKPKELIELFEGDVSSKRKGQILKEEIPKLAYFIWPYGGASQIMKIIKGVDAVSHGGKYTYDKEGNRKLQYPIHNETALGKAGNYAQAILFGRNALSTAQDWVNNGFNTMGVKDTKRFDMLRDNDVKSSYAYDTVNELSNLEEKSFKNYYEYIRDTELSKKSKAELQTTYLSNETDEKRLKAKQQGIDNKTFVDTYYNLTYNEKLYDTLNKHDKEALIRESEKKSSSKLERAYILRLSGLTPEQKLEMDKLLIDKDTKMTKDSYSSEGMFYYSLLTDAKKSRGAQMNKVFGYDARTYYYIVTQLSGCKKKEDKIQKLKEMGFNDYSANVWYNIVYR